MSSAPSHSQPVLLVIGCGNMGSAILSGASRCLSGFTLLGLDPKADAAMARLPPGSPVHIAPTASAIAEESLAAVVLAVKPQVVQAVLNQLAPLLHDALVISIAAGASLEALRAALPGHQRLVRAMPNLPASVGAGMTVAFAEPGPLTDQDKALVVQLFEATGVFAWLDTETQIDAATAVSGSGPGYLFAFAEHLAASGEALGLDADTAALLARQTLIGAGRLLAHDDRPAPTLKAAVTSPGGTTQAGLSVFEAPLAFPACIDATVRAAFLRARALAALPNDP